MPIGFGEFVVDLATRQLRSGVREVHLGPKAFDVLAVLLARRPAVVRKSELLKLVWPDTFVSEASLNVIVTDIRRALGDDPKAPRYIRTVHGVGYAFSAEATDLVAAGGSTPFSRTWLVWNDRTFPLADGETIVGRDPRCGVWVDASGVSRRHARLLVAGGKATIEDLGSRNGTFVGEASVTTARPLDDGDVIRLGETEIRFRAWSEERVPPTERLDRAGRK
jgi:DNA-binding winged helix-turn-helix (wHTH) protein